MRLMFQGVAVAVLVALCVGDPPPGQWDLTFEEMFDGPLNTSVWTKVRCVSKKQFDCLAIMHHFHRRSL